MQTKYDVLQRQHRTNFVEDLLQLLLGGLVGNVAHCKETNNAVRL